MSHATSTTGDASMAAMEIDMIPWLHFTGGDNFFFKTLRPSSHGAIAAACIVLVLIAVFERYVSAMRSVLDAYWTRKAKALRSSPATSEQQNADAVTAKESDNADTDSVKFSASSTDQHSLLNKGRASRSPPFIASHDIPRGITFAFQALLAYILMLAVMTFQAAYIISIVVGLGIGEVLFGRMGTVGDHTLH